ncbi:E3 ubiquitin-protein ligase UBR5 [Lamellibrachia satsuma]|nr:E3 ubiquitin-protein ligase UBR5 [Lamellibrachia satsuma]
MVATWVDEVLSNVSAKLDHSAQSVPEFHTDKVVSLHTCTLYTCARLESGALYWWGVMPFSQRKKLVDRIRSKGRKGRSGDNKGTPEVVTGSQVCLRNSPIYHVGSIGLYTADGVPKIGQLMEAAWTLADTRRFKIKPFSSNTSKSDTKSSDTFKPDMPPPPSPASSTCSDHSGQSMVSPGPFKRKKQPSTSKEAVEKTDEEEWPLSDVVFIEDVRSVPLGKVIKVDGVYAAVKFPSKDGDGSVASGDVTSLLCDCRLMRKDELQVVKGTTAPRIPDCFQRTPKKLSIEMTGHILAVTVDNQGIHLVTRNGPRITYLVYNLSTGKLDQESLSPTDATAFVGRSDKHIQLHNGGERTPVILQDGNKAVYPLAKDCLSGVRDPCWLNLPSIQSIGLCVHSLPNVAPNFKNKLCVIALALERQTLTPHIQRCDIEHVRAILAAIEKEDCGAAKERKLADILQEYCDGNRNLIHTCVMMCGPTCNKDTVSDSTTSTPANSGLCFSSTLDAINAVSSAVDVLAFIQSQCSNSSERVSSRSVSLREMMRRATSASRTISGLDMRDTSGTGGADREEAGAGSGAAIPTLSWPPDPPVVDSCRPESECPSLSRQNSAGASTTANSSTQQGEPLNAYMMPPVKMDDKERQLAALQILKLLCESPLLQPHLLDLLSARNAKGCTPFMQAVCCQAYAAAVTLMDTAKRLASSGERLELNLSVFMSMLYPPNSCLSNSPLHIICCNDTCSFTWTGAEHINQDIFECRTCGLMGSLCCCTECARVCHKGHECKLKKTHPTAYCDCWEKCKCRSLIMGNQVVRFELLNRLLTETDLVKLTNSRGENILLFLVQTVGRQLVEQRQYRPTRMRSSRKAPVSDLEAEMPDHNLEPPRFSRRALERVLNDWPAVKAMLNSGVKEKPTGGQSDMLGDHMYLDTQTGTSQVDKFTHCLLVKCSLEMLDTLLTTLIREMQREGPSANRSEAKLVARRFVRSVARIFTVLSLEMAPQSSRKKMNLSVSQPLVKCKRVFQALINIAIEELCETADALISPVRMGVARPTALFSLVNANVEAIQGSEELFSVDPLPTRSSVTPANVASYIQQSRMADLGSMDHGDQRQDDDDIVSTGDAEVDITDHMDGDNEHMEPPGEQDDHHSEVSDHEQQAGDQEDGVGESDMELDLLDSDSDSDHSNHSNQDNASVQRSAVTAATAGSDAGVGSLAYFSLEEESGESSNQEEDDTDGVDSEDNDGDEVGILSEPLERRTTSGAARSYFYGASCDTERAGCEARMFT